MLHRWISLSLIASLLLGQATAALAQVPVAPVAAAAPDGAGSPVVVTPPRSGKQRVLILRTEGANAGDQARLGATKELHAQALRYKSLDTALSNADLVEEMFEFECTESGVECLGRIGHKYGASLIVFSELSKTPDGQNALTLRLIDSTASRVAQISQQTLEAPDKFQNAVQKGLVVLFGPPDLAIGEVEAPGTLFVQLFAGGVALVYVDDKLAGRTASGRPPAGGLRASVPAGTHTVRVVKAGFRDWTGRVTVPPGGTAEQTVALEQEVDVRPGTGAVAGTPFYKKWWFWTGVGAVVVAGAGVGIYYATKSNPASTGAITLSLDHVDAANDPIFAGKGGGK